MPSDPLIEQDGRKHAVIWDATVFTAFLACARLGDFRYNLDLVEADGKSGSIQMGTLVHLMLETYYADQMAGESLQDASAHALEVAREQLDSGQLQNIKPDDEETVLDTMRAYFKFYDSDFWVPLFAEKVKEEKIYEDDDIRIIWRAKLDLGVDTNQGVYPVDHKTMKQRRDTVKLNHQLMGQCVLMGSRGVIINKIGFQKSLKPSERFTRPIVGYSLDALVEWSQIIVPYWSKVIAAYHDISYFPPNFTSCESKYGICAFQRVCEAPPSAREDTLRMLFVRGEKWDPR